MTLYPEDAKALKDWFGAAYGGRVVPTSQLRLVPHVNGDVWHSGSAEPLSESALAWLVAPLLTLVAFYQQIRGIHAPAFRERLERLREMRVDWVGRIELVVMSDDTEVMRTGVPAHWEMARRTLLLADGARHQPAAMASALAQALDRDDLELPLRVLLGNQASLDEPPENLAGALSTLKISGEHLDSVRQHLRGDVGHAARLVQVLCEVLTPGCDTSSLLASESDEQLASALAACGPPDLPVQDVLRVASESRDAFEFGSTVARKLGPRVELPHWNAALERLKRPPLENREWLQQLRGNLEEARGLVKRVAAHILRQQQPGSFKAMLTQYEALPPSGLSLSRDHWEVNFSAVMTVVSRLVAEWQGAGAVSEALKASESPADLRHRLTAIGVDIEADPDERCRANHQALGAVSERLDRLRQAWWVKGAATAEFGDWHSLRDECISTGKDVIGDRAYTDVLAEADMFAALRDSVAALRTPPAFYAAMKAAAGLAGLRSALSISDTDLSDVDNRLEAQRAEALRRRHLVQVCGEDFDASEENRSRLWRFLQDRVEFEKLADSDPVDLAKSADLLPLGPAKTRDRTQPDRPKTTKPPKRQPKAVDDLIGLAGEIFVFEMLRRRYGSDVVTASSWISSNSPYAFEDNAVDDGAGCDFAFTAGGRSYKVEVKATSGEEPSFMLGSSEIALAMELASRKKGRRARFVLVHVKKVLSATPEAVVLPNPYSANAAGIFRIDQADARVQYRVGE